MYIQSIRIENFKCFKGRFDLNFEEGFTVLVGDNEAGKTTILEAMNLALSGWIYGKHLSAELSESIFNKNIVEDYLKSLKADKPISPPEIKIEIFLKISDDESTKAFYEGNDNSTTSKACGFYIKIFFDENFKESYQTLLSSGEEIKSLPIEFYNFKWSTFARNENINPGILPLKSFLIDSSGSRSLSNSDLHITRMLRRGLSDEDKVSIIQAHRRLKDSFLSDFDIKKINSELQQEISDKKVELSIDTISKTSWETNLMTCLDEIPFGHIGKGEQSLVKTKLAFRNIDLKKSTVVLLEEPENHLSYSKLNKLIEFIKTNHVDKQIIVSTHSSFVANKLNLKNIILLNVNSEDNRRGKLVMNDLKLDTQTYFEKLAGFDTLRLILCRKTVLVEGDSDELIVQKAYLSKYKKLPIEDEVDVISVGTSFLRFLEVAEKLDKKVCVVTDNDRDYDNKVEKKYKDYKNTNNIKIFASNQNDLYSLEPHIVEKYGESLSELRKILDIKEKKYSQKKDVIKYMEDNKTESALKIFCSEKDLLIPEYIDEAIQWAYER